MYKERSKEKSEYKTAVGSTDYNIPMFGYRSAFMVLGITFGVLMIVSLACQALQVESGWPMTIAGGLSFGITIGISQFFLERKKGFTKGFFITVILLSLFCGTLLYLLFIKGVFI